jgi:alpha-tubulin suppressor-like RCC1 family protein
VARVSAGSNFALAEIGVTTAGTTTNRVCSWGDNTDGQLGLGGSSNETTSAGDSPNYCPYVGSSGSSYCSWTPQPVLSVCDGDATATGAPGPLTNVYDISAGTGLALALLNDGSVCSWGDNTHGELGINTFVGPDTCTNNNPQTSGPDTYTNCALSAQQVVTGNCPFTSSFTLNNVVQISAGLYDALALLGGGNVCTWGDGTGGGLGSGASYDSADPIPVVAVGGSGYLSAVTCISAGNQHGLAVVKAASGAGTLLTWGADLATGQNGSSGSTSDPIGVPLSSSSSSGDVTRTSSISAGSGAWNLETRGTKGCMLPPPTP